MTRRAADTAGQSNAAAMTALRLIAAAAACALLGMQALADAADGPARPAGQSGVAAAFQFDGPESSGVKDGARIALTGKPIDGVPTATKPPSATRPLHAGTVTTPAAAAPATSTEAAAGSLPMAELGALVLAGLLAVVTVTRRRSRR